ncbi:biogenesis of lysosome-related organelles complex 1 subunit 1-like [Miscanthus floridulus]|uniref:biogenesis of lysosome-related organelles complex 1 subunit 1-like n=1 Tax=Miscanthus floridulus TaxID=154761 RepID=UPI00345A7207
MPPRSPFRAPVGGHGQPRRPPQPLPWSAPWPAGDPMPPRIPSRSTSSPRPGPLAGAPSPPEETDLPRKTKRKWGIAPATGGEPDGMNGAKPVAGGKQELEDALLQIVHQHHHQSLRQRQQTERAKKDALRSAVRVADLLVATVDGGVQELFVNEKRVELEARALLGTIARYRKQTDQWLAATNEINAVLKEIGYFKNWMKIMDFDCKSINVAIRNIHQS